MAESSIAHCDECVDDFYLSLLTNENEILPISDENYAQELQLQEVLTSSLISLSPTAAAAAAVAAEGKTAAAAASSSRKENETLVRLLQNSPNESKIQKQVGESSHSFCEICMEGKPAGEMFRSKMICSHSYCRECIAKHVASKIQENVITVKCPDLNCKAVLEPSQCRAIIPDEVFDRWSSSMCESLILGSSRFYCPFKDCSGVMLVEEDGKERPIVTQSECPYCRRLFCAQCKVPWHSEVACEMFQKLEKSDTRREDLMAVELANKLKWKRCPQCNFFVEKREGCLHIACRCGFHFCYGCGKKYTATHASCQ